MVHIENKQDGIVKVRQNNEEYIIWAHASVVIPYIKKFLREKFPGKLIARELNRIDLSIPKENLPIEIQATKYNRDKFVFAGWEDAIRRQIDQGIVYGECWFFFDSELLRAMKVAGIKMSINMVWFRELIKEERLKVFTVSHNGIIEEKVYKDFDFLAEISQTCKLAAETDDMILNKNKLKIFDSVVDGYGFTQDEIDKFEDDCKKYCEANKMDNTDENGRISQFLMKQTDKRARLYGGILQAIGNLPGINRLLDIHSKNADIHNRKISAVKYKQYASLLGIFDVEGSGNKFITTFIDRFNICRYIPGYVKNKNIWVRLTGHGLSYRQFENIIKSTNNGITIDDYFWYEKSDNNIQIKDDKDKEVNVEIKDKDKTITITIKNTRDAGW